MCRQLSIRSSVEEVLITLDYITLHYITLDYITLHYHYFVFFYLVCNYLVCNFWGGRVSNVQAQHINSVSCASIVASHRQGIRESGRLG